MARKPDKRTIKETIVSVREWRNLGHKTHVPCTITKKHPNPRLHGAVVYVIGPPKAAVKAAKVLNRILIVKNKTLMVRIKTMQKKSNKYEVGDEIEVKPTHLRSAW